MRNLYWILITVFLVGCYEDEKIVPSEGQENYFQLPQGNHDYDSVIMNYHNLYGFYMLYDFQPEDVYWTGTNWDEYLGGGNISDRDGIGADLFVRQADPAYVGKLLDLTETVFLKHYTDELLKKMPLEFYFCSKLNKIGSSGDTSQIHVYRNFHCMAVNWGGVEIDTMGRGLKMDYQRALNFEFLTYLNESETFELCEDFVSVCDYKYAYLRGEQLFAKGYLNASSLVVNNVSASQINDFQAYMELLAIPLEILEGEPAPILDYQAQSTPPLEGCLNPKRDVNGLVRKKYEILVKYFQEEYGLDVAGWQRPDF